MPADGGAPGEESGYVQEPVIITINISNGACLPEASRGDRYFGDNFKASDLLHQHQLAFTPRRAFFSELDPESFLIYRQIILRSTLLYFSISVSPSLHCLAYL